MEGMPVRESDVRPAPAVQALSEPIEFVLPAVPLSLNIWGRAHWSVRARERARWTALFLAYAPRGRHIVDPARVTLTFYGRTDPDNCAKVVLDCLKGKFITDDRYPHLNALELRQRPGEHRTAVRIEAIT